MIAYYNTESHKVWVSKSAPTEAYAHLREADSRMDAYRTIGEEGLFRYSNWVPAYGPVLQCEVRFAA